MVFTMLSTTLIHAVLRFPDDTFSNDIWPMAMDYDVWVYNRILYMKSGLSAIGIWSRSRFEPVSETLINCHVWGFQTYVLEPKLIRVYDTGSNLDLDHISIADNLDCISVVRLYTHTV